MSEAKIDEFPCIFPASREFRVSRDGFARDCLLQRRVRCEPVSRGNSPSYVEKPRFSAGVRAGALSSAGATAREQSAAIQVASLRAAVPEHACRRSQYLQSSTPSRLPIHAAKIPNRCCRVRRVSADRAARPGPHTRGKPRLLDLGRRIPAERQVRT